MINHARTLILNSLASTRPALGMYGEEYTPTEYIVRNFTQDLVQIRSTLLGNFNDPLYQNYRLAQLMSIAHANFYANSYFMSLDSRITYSPTASGFSSAIFGTVIEPATTSAMQIKTSGMPAANDGVGRSLFQWQLTTATGPILVVRDLKDKNGVETELVIADKYSNFIELSNGLVVQLYVPTGAWATDISWIVSSMSRPVVDIGMLPSIFSQKAVYSLMQTASVNASNLWKKGPTLPDKLSGILMAFVEKAESIGPS